ncbi:hypothetical protein I203_101373 [Kwoniella mangroviensis CBS 8507]|uniref:uncharacterized protein n=1 Tax=Kwoniella mangroviensis CBS 8507 TaxID=1296122 RepID=UPI00080CD0D3|nr:uncharacterized protein I203_03011 [Kwoniella mangroviensis CBS 8507]OCF68343.1 hypothetical protein I203_03011 [Kwoniella mangroviensis CBS 8507]
MQLGVLQASIENTDTGLPFREHGYHHVSKEDGMKSSFCYLEVQKGAPFAIAIEMSPTFTRSRSDDWRAACFIDGHRLSGSYWNPDAKEHRIDSMLMKKGTEFLKCKMRFGSIEQIAERRSIPVGEEEGDNHLGRVDIVLSRGMWIPLGDATADRAEQVETVAKLVEGGNEDPDASDPITSQRKITRPMMFAEKADEPCFYSFHFILQTRETLVDYGLIRKLLFISISERSLMFQLPYFVASRSYPSTTSQSSLSAP